MLEQQLHDQHEELDKLAVENTKIQERSNIDQACLSQKICELTSQLALCKAEREKEASNKKVIKPKVELTYSTGNQIECMSLERLKKTSFKLVLETKPISDRRKLYPQATTVTLVYWLVRCYLK